MRCSSAHIHWELANVVSYLLLHFTAIWTLKKKDSPVWAHWAEKDAIKENAISSGRWSKTQNDY